MGRYIPCDDKLKQRGCNIPSKCNLCGRQEESIFHLFFLCDFAVHIWRWLGTILQTNLQFLSIQEVWSLCDRGWSPHCKLVMQAAIVNIFYVIWQSRNAVRFNNKSTHWKSAISSIIAGVSLSASNSKLAASSSMTEFTFLKAFNCKINPPKHSNIKEVIWHPPILNWIKCNCDGAALGSPGLSSCGGVFRNSQALFLGGFAEGLSIGNSLIAELSGVMRTIEIAKQRGYSRLWIETDSKLAVLAFKSSNLIPWKIRNRWDNCMEYISNIAFLITHIYREGNVCADKFANIGLSLNSLVIYDTLPVEVRADYVQNRL